MSRICGTGAVCEQVCPIMSAGRDCPDLFTFIGELNAVCEGSPELAPQPA